MINERQSTYGDAWRITGVALAPLAEELYNFLVMVPEFFIAWLMIFNKLIRLLADPYHRDSWEDIIGYATLVIRYIDSGGDK